MASKLGSVFVELNLDDKIYKQKLSEQLTSTQATAKGIETSWRALGVKSDAYFDMQRRSAENAYTLIKNSALSTSNDIVRAEKAKNDRIKQLNEQQFGHQKSIIDNLKSHWIAAAAVIAASMAAVYKAWGMIKAGADYDEQKGILDNLARKYSMTADSIVESMKRASNGQIANADLMQVALAGIAKNLKPEQLINLADAAKILGDSVGQNATVALKELSEALESGRAKALKGYAGSTIDLKDAFGELESKMSAAEKSQAMYALIMIHATKLQREQKTEVDETADKIEQLEAKWKNLTTEAERFAKNVAVSGYERLFHPFDTLKSNINDIVKSFKNISNGGWDTGVVRHTKDQETADDKSKNQIKAFEDQIKSLKNLLQTREDNKKSVIEMDKIQEKAYLKEMELLEARDKEEIEYFKNYNKRVVDQAAEAIKTGSENLAAENKMKIEGWNALAEKHKEINAAMTEQEKYELSQRLNSYNEIYSMISEISNAGAAGSYQGIGMLSENVKGITDIDTGQDRYSKEMEAAQEHYAKLEELSNGQLEQETIMREATANRDMAIENAKSRQHVSLASRTFGALSGLAYAFYEASGKQNEAAFLAYKAFAIAQAIVCTAMGVSRAIGEFKWPFNLIVAATVAAAGAAQIANIASAQIGSSTSASASISGSVTSASTSTTESASAGATSTTTETKSAVSLNVYVEGNIIDQDAFARTLIPSLTKAIQDGAH